LTIVTRMEAYSGSTTGVNDDSSRECVRMVAAPFEHKNDVDDRIGKLEETVQNQKDEIAKLKSRSGHAQRPSGPHAPGSSGNGAQGGHTGGNAVGRNGGAVVTAGQPPQQPQWTSPQAVLPTARGPAATAGAGPTQPPWQPRAAATPLAPGEAVQSLPAGYAMGQFGAYIDGSPVGYGGAYPAAGIPATPDTVTYPPGGWYNPANQRRRSRRQQQRPLPRGVCSRCYQRGHWRAGAQSLV